jgi:glyoxylase-like metal-dependent hydrolase (beta-lactamase superfamily II)
MRRALRTLLFALCAAVTVSVGAQPAVRAVEVAERIWAVQGEAALGSTANRNFISNAGFVVGNDGVLVVDALGSPALASELLAEIRRVTPLPVRWVVVTHYHADHIYGLQVFRAAGATVLAHADGRAYLNSDTARQRLEASRRDIAPWIDARTELVAADRWLTEPVTRLDLGALTVEVRHTGPAHTAEDLVVWVPQRGALFAGDLFFAGRVPFVGQADSRRWIGALDGLLALRPRVVVPGHGSVSTEPAADIALTRDYLAYLRRTMGEAARNLEPFDEAYAKTDWSRWEAVPLFRAANRMNAYNTYLLMEQEPPR